MKHGPKTTARLTVLHLIKCAVNKYSLQTDDINAELKLKACSSLITCL